jgi:hypothetical protein
MVDPYSRGARAIAIALRTAHLLTMALFVGGLFVATPDPSARTWRLLTVVTGAALLLSEASHGRHWLYQGRGVATLAHIGALGLLGVGGMERTACTAALVIGAIGSHMPRSLRKWSFRHRRVVD